MFKLEDPGLVFSYLTTKELKREREIEKERERERQRERERERKRWGSCCLKWKSNLHIAIQLLLLRREKTFVHMALC